MTTAQAAPRLGVDASTVIKYINHGLRIPSKRKRAERLYLGASRIAGAGGPLRWSITATAVRSFNAERRRLGL